MERARFLWAVVFLLCVARLYGSADCRHASVGGAHGSCARTVQLKGGGTLFFAHQTAYYQHHSPFVSVDSVGDTTVGGQRWNGGRRVGGYRTILNYLQQDEDVPTFPFSSSKSSSSSPSSTSSSPPLPSPNAYSQWLVHVKGPITPLLKLQLHSVLYPYLLSSYLPHNTFFLVAPAVSAQALLSNGNVLAVVAFQSQFKTNLLLPATRTPGHIPHRNSNSFEKKSAKHKERGEQHQGTALNRTAAVLAVRSSLRAAHLREGEARGVGGGRGAKKVTYDERKATAAVRYHEGFRIHLSFPSHADGERLREQEKRGGDSTTQPSPVFEHSVCIECVLTEWKTWLNEQGGGALFSSSKPWFDLRVVVSSHPVQLSLTFSAPHSSRPGHPASTHSSASTNSSTSLNHDLLPMPLSVTPTQILLWLLERPEVHWVEKFNRQFSVHNNFARYVIQADTQNNAWVWRHNLTGDGQVGVVGDTGLDFDHCFFADEDTMHAVPLNRISSTHRKLVTYVTYPDSTAFSGDHFDHANGHGTHVAGSMSGNAKVSVNRVAEERLSEYNGMAFMSKLAIFDFQGANDANDDLLLPVNVYTEYYEASHKAGGRVSSNSWGTTPANYESYAHDTDRFIHDYPDYVCLFAGGNEGDQGYFTLVTPAVSKNVITVGSTSNHADSFAELRYMEGIEVRVNSVKNEAQTGTANSGVDLPGLSQTIAGLYATTPALFGPHFSEIDSVAEVQVVWVDNLAGCSQTDFLQEPDAGGSREKAAWTGKVVMMARDRECSFVRQALAVQAAGGVLLVVVNFQGKLPFSMEPSVSEYDTKNWVLVKIPCVMMFATDAQQFVPYLPHITLAFPAPYISDDSAMRLSGFSGRGPTNDNRIKPDILAPGEFITSARSDGDLSSHQCNQDINTLLALQGTSMATPIAAGAALLVRQYFQQGFFPIGVLDPAFDERVASAIPSSSPLHTATSPPALHDPSAALVKAMLIHSAVAVDTGDAASQLNAANGRLEMGSIPSMQQGFGRIQLDRVLVFKEKAMPRPPPASPDPIETEENQVGNLFVFDFPDRAMATHETHSFCFHVIANATVLQAPVLSSATASKKGPLNFKASLVWTDPPADITSVLNLVNNLDLAVFNHYSDTLTVGNHGLADSAENWDLLNNVEQVSLTMLEVGHYLSVSVHATNVPLPAQAYALVVSGSVERVSLQKCALYSDRVDGGAVNDQVQPEDGNDTNKLSLQGARQLCPRACASHGFCNSDGRCICEGLWTGSGCSSESQLLVANGPTVSGTLRPNQWNYFHFPLQDTDTSLSLHAESVTGDPDFYLTDVSDSLFPSLTHYAEANRACDTCGTRNHWFVIVPSPASTNSFSASPLSSIPKIGTTRIPPSNRSLSSFPAGFYKLGVYGYCCSEVNYFLTLSSPVDLTSLPTPPTGPFLPPLSPPYVRPASPTGFAYVVQLALRGVAISTLMEMFGLLIPVANNAALSSSQQLPLLSRTALHQNLARLLQDFFFPSSSFSSSVQGEGLFSFPILRVNRVSTIFEQFHTCLIDVSKKRLLVQLVVYPPAPRLQPDSFIFSPASNTPPHNQTESLPAPSSSSIEKLLQEMIQLLGLATPASALPSFVAAHLVSPVSPIFTSAMSTSASSSSSTICFPIEEVPVSLCQPTSKAAWRWCLAGEVDGIASSETMATPVHGTTPLPVVNEKEATLASEQSVSLFVIVLASISLGVVSCGIYCFFQRKQAASVASTSGNPSSTVAEAKKKKKKEKKIKYQKVCNVGDDDDGIERGNGDSEQESREQEEN